MTDTSATRATTSRTGGKLVWLLLVLGTLVALVCGGWFLGAQLYRAALDEGRAQLARQGVTIACADETLAGFPFRFELRCSSLTVEQDGRGRVSGAALTTVAPAWNPLFTIIEWTGPFDVTAANGSRASIDSPLARASLRLDTGLQPQRLSVVLDPASLTMDGAPQAIASANGLELHARVPETEGHGAADRQVALLMFGFESLLLGGVERIDLSLSGIIGELMAVQGGDPRAALRDWVARSGSISGFEGRLRLDDHAINLDGDATLATDGLVDFTGTIATNDVPALLELMGIGEDDGAAAISAGATLFGRQTSIGEDRAVELPVRAERSRVAIGPVPLGQLPPLAF